MFVPATKGIILQSDPLYMQSLTLIAASSESLLLGLVVSNSLYLIFKTELVSGREVTTMFRNIFAFFYGFEDKRVTVLVPFLKWHFL